MYTLHTLHTGIRLQWYHMNIKVFQFIARLTVQRLVQTNTEENLKTLYDWPFEKETCQRWISLTKGQ